MQPVKELLDAIQNEAEFENIEVEKAILNVLELLNKDLIYVQYEQSSDVEAAVISMNKIVARAESEIIDDEDDDDEDDSDDLILDDEDEEEDEDLIDLTPETDSEDGEEPNGKSIPSTE